MMCIRRQSWLWGLALGAIGGLLVGGLWPSTPLHAVATDHSEGFSMATGFVDDGIEAVFLLDHQTGTLQGAVPSSTTKGFQSLFTANLAGDLTTAIAAMNQKIASENLGRKKKGVPARPDVQIPQTPKFMIVTGAVDLRRGAARVRPGLSMVYVAETGTGMIMAYAVPWSPEMHNTDRPYVGALILWAWDQFSGTVTRTE